MGQQPVYAEQTPGQHIQQKTKAADANVCGVLTCLFAFLQTTTAHLEFEYVARELWNELTLGKSMALINLFDMQVVWRSETLTISGILHFETTC